MSRVVEIWNGNGFFLKTYQDDSGYYHTVVTSPDFTTEEEVQEFNKNASEYFVRYNHG